MTLSPCCLIRACHLSARVQMKARTSGVWVPISAFGFLGGVAKAVLTRITPRKLLARTAGKSAWFYTPVQIEGDATTLEWC